ncbi:uncharacterized protein LOC120748880 [Hirundo rustica]|uniref:uncharacterized protein LOC120748880 n=1 Tax=Hirundo rustica TaxID=43150 RepID=UPI00267378A0|nr:uncharacterized protein LOC120748880 [Hirundo rustica]
MGRQVFSHSQDTEAPSHLDEELHMSHGQRDRTFFLGLVVFLTVDLLGSQLPGLGRNGWKAAQKKRIWECWSTAAEHEPACAQMAKKSDDILVRISNSLQDQGSDCPLYWALLRPHLKSCVQFWAPHCKKDIEGLECGWRRATELGKGLEHKADEEWLRELGAFILEKRRGRKDLITLYSHLKVDCSQVRVSPFSQVTSDTTSRNDLRLLYEGFRLDMRESIFTE